MVDTTKDSYEMDYESLGNHITEKTKAIIPVDIAGKPINYDAIFDVVKSKKDLFNPKRNSKSFNRIIVIADAAHSFGAKVQNVAIGNIADFTCFHFMLLRT